jgi:hypothetical protein
MLWHFMGARVKGESSPHRTSDNAWESDPSTVRPTRIVQPSPTLCGCCARRSVSFRDTAPPTSIPPTRRTLERGRCHPRKGYDVQLHTRLRRCRDIRPKESVSSITSGPVRPSPPLYGHPGHCGVIPRTVGTQVDRTSLRPLLCSLQSSVSRTLESVYGHRSNKSFS